MSAAAQGVLVTGASSGIGEETARHLHSRGMRVFGTSRKPAYGPGECDQNGIEWLALDVCDDESVAHAFDELDDRCERLDGVVCNAGMGIFGSVEEVSIEDARFQFETNFFGTLRTARAALPRLRETRGRLVLVGSLAGRAAIPFQAHYSASKAAVDALAMALHNELRGTGVHVSLVEPGDIDTPFNDAMEWGEFENSPYRDAMERTEAVIRESLPKAPKPIVVARAVERALTAKRPRLRYACGADSLGVPLGRRLLPDRLFRSLVGRHFGLSGPR